jgi:hypothetical protein
VVRAGIRISDCGWLCVRARKCVLPSDPLHLRALLVECNVHIQNTMQPDARNRDLGDDARGYCAHTKLMQSKEHDSYKIGWCTSTAETGTRLQLAGFDNTFQQTCYHHTTATNGANTEITAIHLGHKTGTTVQYSTVREGMVVGEHVLSNCLRTKWQQRL